MDRSVTLGNMNNDDLGLNLPRKYNPSNPIYS